MPKREYKKYEFCKDMKCVFLTKYEPQAQGQIVSNRCVVNENDCPITAKALHNWLNKNEFKIVKDD